VSAARRKIAVPLVDRANYGRIKPVLRAIEAHPELELQVVCSGSMVLERFGSTSQELVRDGFEIAGQIYVEVEGSVPSTMAKSLGLGVIEFASELQRLRPDLLLAIGDRYEMLAAVLAAACMNVTIAHIQGGEVSGSIDESIRHAITKFAHYHFPSTRRAADYLVQMGEPPDHVFAVGCPSSDIAFGTRPEVDAEAVNATGAGAWIDPARPYALVVFHPVTTGFGAEVAEVHELLAAVEESRLPVLWLWPNIDAGADHISKALRVYRENHHPDWLRVAKNYNPEVYAAILSRAAVAVGNSSSFVRDSGFYGTPVVLVGARQEGREFSDNVVPVEPKRDAILAAVRSQLEHGRFAPSTLYGDGQVAPRIAAAVAELPLFTQKRLDYIRR
jgi:UDP-hydrolysing UDP-N-acetyl-D-glucosamine 2-epimerase